VADRIGRSGPQPPGATPACEGRNCRLRRPQRPAKESLQASLDRLKTRVQAKQQEIKDLEVQAKQVEQAIKALG
jgi:predicted  nucleic acid-binding Zn-ribbon protein